MTTLARFSIPPDHPALAGHFPGRPIVPGVVLLDHVVRAIEDARGLAFGALGIGAAKFLQPVGPGVALDIETRDDVHGGVRFTVSAGASAVVTGVLTQQANA